MRAAAVSVVRRLQAAGCVAYFAGGCVRDMLMGKPPSDYDVATSAPPGEVIKQFRRTQRVGAKFGVVLVRTGGHSIEVATFRRDVDYADGRRPTTVQFTDAREDAIRRDFTINGMFYDPVQRKVVDFVGGREDLRRKTLRAIGDANQRFREDHLRIMRAVRFAARLNFAIEPGTWEAMRVHAPHIARISPERIREELEAMLIHPSRADAFALLCDCGVFQYLWPGAEQLLVKQDHLARQLDALPRDSTFELGLAVLLSCLPAGAIGPVCDGLRTSNETKKVVNWLLRQRPQIAEPNKLSLADLKLLMAHPAFDALMSFFSAWLRASDLSPAPFRQMAQRVRRVPPAAISPSPLLTGHDLEEMGLAKGPIYKRILDRIYYMQLNGEIGDRRQARAHARGLISAPTSEK
jgi:poly(A) polymerase